VPFRRLEETGHVLIRSAFINQELGMNKEPTWCFHWRGFDLGSGTGPNPLAGFKWNFVLAKRG
jgi:hypothetical protein